MREEDLKALLSKDYDRKTVLKIIDGLRFERNVSLRVNTLKSSREEIINVFKDRGIKYRDVSWFSNAFITLDCRSQDIKNLDIYKEGKIYLQSLSAMIPALILDVKENDMILDMTAAPGGKTTEIAALGGNKVMITAVEKNKIRADRLKYNVDKLGAKKVTIINEDARWLNDNYIFDKVLLDAPCSGSGTLKITDGVVEQVFNQELIDRSVRVQEELLFKALKMININCEVVYATCSILKKENEDMIKKFIDKKLIEIVPIDVDNYKDVPLLPTTMPGVLCIAPNKDYEGFFVAKLRKVKN